MNELKSYTEYAVSTPTADFVIGFDFNYGEDAVNVTVDDVPATEAGYTVVYLNETTIRLSPSVPSGVVRLQRETDIDQTDHAYRAGAKFIAQTMDENFEQLRHSQQEVRDGFNKLSTDTHEIIEGLDTALELAQDAAQDAQDAAVIAQGAADTVNTIIVGGKVGAVNVLDASGETQQQVNYNGGSKWHSRVGGYKLNERVVLTNGDIVKSTIDGNTNDPNVDMTGWVLETTQEFVTNDGAVVGGVNVKSKTIYSSIAPDVRMSYIAFGGHVGFPNKIGTFVGSGASYSTISGGYDNQIDCIAGTISGGAHHRLYGNLANTTHNTVGGGSFNDVERGEYVTISGGTLNKVKSKRRDGVTNAVPTHSTVGGGRGNIIHGGNSTIAGGLNNSADGDTATVGGGQSNKADGNFSTVAGGGNNEARLGTGGLGQKNTISGGRFNIIDSATNPGGNVIGGGENNNVFGSYNTVSGGFNCDIGISGTEPSYAAIGGGLDNAITGSNNASVIAGGRSNIASANYAGITHGRGNLATAQYSRAGGFEAVARIDGCDTIANGKFSVAGDAQSTVAIGKAITTNETPTQIGNTILLNDNTTHFVTALIVARRSDAQNESAAYKVEFVVDRQTGAATSALVGAPIITTIAEDDALMNVGISVNASAGGWYLSATGVAAKTVRWVARNTIVEVSS